MAKKPQQVARLPDEDLPPYVCGQCWYYEPDGIDHGPCFDSRPVPIIAEDGEIMHVRPIVMHDDRGCSAWKARHKA